jgi:sensor histidine kinase YesM
MTTQSTNKTSYFTPILHFVVWGALFSFPVLLMPTESIDWSSMITRHWLPLIFSASLFYLNYFYLIRKFLFTSKVWQFLGINAAIIILLLFGFEWFKEIFDLSSIKSGPHKPFKIFFYFRIFISYLLPLGVSVAIKSTQRFLESEIERKNRENDRLRNELNYLHYQIQPHFFFNSLNSVYALINENPDQAQKALHKLSKLMRYVLYDGSQANIGIDKEIEFIKNYIELMQVRQGHSLNIKTTFPNPIPSIEIEPLLLIPLVENAFKHSVFPGKESIIDVKLTINSEQLVFEVLNSNHPKNASDRSGSGIGLQNLTKRLNHLYPNKYKLTISERDDFFIAQLTLNL